MSPKGTYAILIHQSYHTLFPLLGSRGDDKLHFLDFKRIHLGMHTLDNSKQLSNTSSVSIFKKLPWPNYFFMFSAARPGVDVRATGLPAVSWLSPLLPGGRRRRRCNVDTDLQCLLRLGVVPSGGGAAGGRCILVPGRDRDPVYMSQKIRIFYRTFYF